MRRIALVPLTVLARAFPIYVTVCRSHSTSGGKRVFAGGDVRKDGSYVPGPYRNAPASGYLGHDEQFSQGRGTTYPLDATAALGLREKREEEG